MIVVCVKWVGATDEPGDERFAGISHADQAALELALRQAEGTGHSSEVVAVTAGPPTAELALRDAIACGADRAVRIDLAADAASAVVASELAAVTAGATFVWCGDLSTDRGSGSVPAFLAAHLGAAQALGGVTVDLRVDRDPPTDGSADGDDDGDGDGDGGSCPEVTRRLDGGRREVVRITAPAVISVEGAAARLRRAGLGALLAARSVPVEVRPASAGFQPHFPTTTHPYRPRARALPAPTGSTLERLRALTDATRARAHGETVHLDPDAAAQRIVDALLEWRYLPD